MWSHVGGEGGELARAEGPHTVRSHVQEGPWLRGIMRSNVQEGSQGLGVIHTVRSHVQKRGPGVGWSNASNASTQTF